MWELFYVKQKKKNDSDDESDAMEVGSDDEFDAMVSANVEAPREKPGRRAATKVSWNIIWSIPLISNFFLEFLNQKIDYSLLNDGESKSSGSDSEPEMFDNVLETSSAPQMIVDSDSEAAAPSSGEPTPIKKPAPAKRKLGPKPAASKRKIVSSDSESSPIKKKVRILREIAFPTFTYFLKLSTSSPHKRRRRLNPVTRATTLSMTRPTLTSMRKC